jgi:hypothetical protein
MPKPLPTPPPELVYKMDQLLAACSDMLNRYVHGFEMDMNRHAVKHGPMSDAEAHWHVTKILAKDVPPNMLAGLAAAAIVRGIKAKTRGEG